MSIKYNQTYAWFVNGSHTDESARELVPYAIMNKEGMNIWKYNQIIGYIEVSVSKNDIWFDIHRSLDKKYYSDSKTKHFIVDMGTSGLHFRVANYSNDFIKSKIRGWLLAIHKDHLKSTFFIDYSIFDNILDYLDIGKIMNDM